jgi:hypothetical protein
MILVVMLSASAPENSFASGLFQNSSNTRIVDIERLAELSSVYLDDNGGFRFSELNWSSDGNAIFVETTGRDNIHHMWKIALDGNSSHIEQIDFPYDKFSEIYGFKLSFNGDMLFAAVPEYNGSEIYPEPANLYKLRLGESNFIKLTDFTDPSSTTFISNFDWMPEGNIVYETVTPIYPEDPNEPIDTIKALWTTLASSGGESVPTMIWNGTESIVSRFMDASPDGNYLAFGGDTRLRIFDSRDGNFTDIASKDQWNAKGIYPSSPKWSENSEFIVYWQTEYHKLPSSPLFPKDNITTWLRIASSDGSINEAVFRNPGPILSSELPTAGISLDGRYIAVAVPYVPYNYADDDVDNGGIYLIDLGSHVIPEFPSGALIIIGPLVAGAVAARYWHHRTQ